MRFKIVNIQRTALHFAIEKENVEIVKLLLARPEIDINILYILYVDDL